MTTRYLPLDPPAAPLFAPPAGPSAPTLAVAAWRGDDPAADLYVTDLVTEAELALAWRGLEAAYRWSGGTFALAQRVGHAAGAARALDLAGPPPDLVAFDRTNPWYTTEVVRPDGRLVLVTAEGAGWRASVVDEAALRRRWRGLAVDTVAVALRLVGSVAWHIHM